MSLVRLEDPVRTPLLGLLMRGLLEANLAAEPRLRELVGRLAADVEVTGGTMTLTLRFRGGEVALLPGKVERPSARVSGSLDALLGLVAHGRMLWPFLTGAIRIGGNPLLLLRLLPLIRARG